MADLIAFHRYYSNHTLLSPSTMMSPPNNHQPSVSSGPRSRSAERAVTKAKSTNDLGRAASDNAVYRTSSSGQEGFSESDFNTIKDPRVAHSSDDSESSSTPSHHPDLNNEVAALSVKLVQAINNQTTLDDDLVAARQELADAQTRIQALELENGKYRRDIDQEVLVKKVDMDYEVSCLKASLAEEQAQRAHVEKDKKTIEQELETLTAALFEEANKMVAVAKLEREAVEKKNEQLRSQVKDTELLLASHQDQLAELKAALHRVTPTKDETDTHTTVSTTPSSPIGTRQRMPNAKTTIGIDDTLKAHPNSEEILPGPSTSFPYIKPVCRTDIPAYEDFRELFSLATSSKPPSRAASGSYGGLNVMSLASLAGHTAGFGSTSSSPVRSQTHSPNGSLSSPQSTGWHIPLKESRFYKRALMEDIEPTLRLDAAPGISWLTRRTVLSGICEGSLIVEPMPHAAKKFGFACSLCGEHRGGAVNERTHRFRTSDSETAQRYPLCVVCLEKVRSCCEFTGYLRLILDGHVRVGDTEEEKEVWEETVRLRERMFWSRISAGVMPILPQVNAVDGAAHEVESTNSIYTNDNASYRPTSGNSAIVQAGHEHNDDQESITDEHYLSATEQSSASSAVDVSSPLENTEPRPFGVTKNETPKQATEETVDQTAGQTIEQLANSATVHLNGKAEAVIPEVLNHDVDYNAAKAENHEL